MKRKPIFHLTNLLKNDGVENIRSKLTYDTIIVLLIYGIRYLTILLQLDLPQDLNGALTNLTFLTFYFINNLVSSS